MDYKRRDYDLYYGGTLVVFDNGEQLLTRQEIQYESKDPDIYHTVIEGETLTGIAWQYYKNFTDPIRANRYWKYIADVNGITNPLDLTDYIGTDIIIPNYNLIRLKE